MYDDDKISTHEKEIIFKQFEDDLEKHYHNGRIIVFNIAILNIIFSIINNIMGNFSILKIIVQIVLSTALFMGVKWVRYLFVVGALLSIIFNLYIFSSYMAQDKVICLVSCLIHAIISGSLLAFNKSVSDFLYYQRTR